MRKRGDGEEGTQNRQNERKRDKATQLGTPPKEQDYLSMLCSSEHVQAPTTGKTNKPDPREGRECWKDRVACAITRTAAEQAASRSSNNYDTQGGHIRHVNKIWTGKQYMYVYICTYACMED